MPTKSLAVAVVVAGVVIAGVVAGGGRATPPPSPSAQALDLSHNSMSPFCPGLTLAACPSPQATELRAELRGRFEGGETRDAIVDDLVRRYGAQVTGTPPTTGFGSTVYALPFVVALGLGVAVRLVTRSGHEANQSDATTPSRPDLATRLDDELEDME